MAEMILLYYTLCCTCSSALNMLSGMFAAQAELV